MGTTRNLFTWGSSACALVLLLGGSAFGQVQNKDQQKCINTLNKDTCKVAATQGKENSGCVKAGTKGTATAGCLTADAKGKVGKAESKTTADETKNTCLTTNAPNFGYTSAAAGNTASRGREVELFDDTYGTTDPTTVISTAKLEGGCQSTVTKDLEKVIATKWKEYVGCKKAALKNGASTAAGLEICVTPGGIAADAKGKIGKTISKLNADITKKCTGVTVSSTFPGDCSGATLGTLGQCLDRRAECRICLALNDTDGLNVNCDLFDDGLANGSCGIVLHKCVLNTTGCSPSVTPSCGSFIQIHIAALPVPLKFGLSGALDIGAGGPVGTCGIQSLSPVNIPSIGVVCIQPSSGCPAGTRWCGPGPGPALGIDVQSDGMAGACTSNAQCTASAAATCTGEFGAGYVPLSSACTGFCSGGAMSACTSDAQCAGLGQDACNGPDPIGGNANVCQISCINTASHGPSAAGAIQCNLGSNLVVENAAPCDGTDVKIQVGQTCIPVSTEEASSLITDANFTPASTVPPSPNVNDLVGASVSCATLDSSTTTGLRGTGAVNFFGSALGDLAVGIESTCN